MKERPILFSALMVRAILDGRKTQTRRVLKNQPEIIKDPFPTTDEVKGVFKFKESTGIYQCLGMQNLIETCPYGQPGDRLWVRETWLSWRWNNSMAPREMAERWGDDDRNRYIGYLADNDICRDNIEMDGRHRPSIHMPRWASRINLKITGVRVERLQDISESDAKKEGCMTELDNDWSPPYPTDTEIRTYRAGYRFLWESINGQGSWDQNPWVWVIEFKRL